MWINDRRQKSQNGSAQDERFRIDIQLKTVGKASIIETKIVVSFLYPYYRRLLKSPHSGLFGTADGGSGTSRFAEAIASAKQ